MDANKNQDLIIVNAISQMVIPNDIFEKSEFRQIISKFKSAQSSVEKSLDLVEKKRNAVKEGNAVVNWLKDREAELQDAQLSLNQSVGLLTKQSSDLILFNTAISKVLVSQQKVLHEQQELLQKQATELGSQNKCIQEQQIELSKQQERLLEVNKGLLEAKGITKEHAEKLVGCVKRVETAEQQMERSNQELERVIVRRIVDCEERTESFKAEVDKLFSTYRQEAAVGFEALSAEYNSVIEGVRIQLSNVELNINAESEVRKQAVISLAEKFTQHVDELQNEQEVREKKLVSELRAGEEILASQIASLSERFGKHKIVLTEKNQRLLYFSVSALIVSGLSLAASAYVYFVALYGNHPLN